MRVRYSFSSRRTGRIENIRKQKQKYPSIVKKIVETSDIILEVLDARFIEDTRNIELEKEIKKQGKTIIYVLNKADLIDKKKIKKKDLVDLYPYAFVSCTSRRGSKDLREKIRMEAKKITKPLDKRFGKITLGVIGYPNTGKSSLINFLIGKSSAGTGAEAGFTKGIQKLKLTSEIVLLDSPGVIPQKDYSSTKTEALAKHTKVGGRSYSQVKNPDFVIATLMKEFPEVLEKFYKIKAKKDSEILLEELGRKKGFLKKGDEVNVDQTARFILKDWQEGKIKI